MLIFFLLACQNQQKQEVKETKQIITQRDRKAVLETYMKEHNIGYLYVSQEQRQFAKQNLDFIAKFLAPFLDDESFISLFISESKKT